MENNNNQNIGKTKRCKYCCSEIPIEATICKVCFKPQEEKARNVDKELQRENRILIGGGVIGIGIVLFLLFAFGEFEDITQAALEFLFGIVALVIGSVLILKH